MIVNADLMVTKDENIKIKLDQAVNITAPGTVGGSFWGNADRDDIPQPALGCGGRCRCRSPCPANRVL
jgi:hypothetical protein